MQRFEIGSPDGMVLSTSVWSSSLIRFMSCHLHREHSFPALDASSRLIPVAITQQPCSAISSFLYLSADPRPQLVQRARAKGITLPFPQTRDFHGVCLRLSCRHQTTIQEISPKRSQPSELMSASASPGRKELLLFEVFASNGQRAYRQRCNDKGRSRVSGNGEGNRLGSIRPSIQLEPTSRDQSLPNPPFCLPLVSRLLCCRVGAPQS